jgi:hypothetical protein
LSALSYGAAFVVWNVVGLAFFAAVIWATFGRSWRLVGFTALAPAALFCLWLGQTGLIMAALLVGGIGWLWRRPVLAGILMGFLTCKPPLGLLVPFALVAGGHWRAFVSACLTAGVLILASLAVFGLEGWTAYLENLPGRQVDLQEAAGGIIVNLSPTILMAARLLGLAGVIQFGLQALVAAGVLACVMWAFRGGRDPGLCCALLFVGTMLASPFSLVAAVAGHTANRRQGRRAHDRRPDMGPALCDLYPERSAHPDRPLGPRVGLRPGHDSPGPRGRRGRRGRRALT